MMNNTTLPFSRKATRAMGVLFCSVPILLLGSGQAQTQSVGGGPLAEAGQAVGITGTNAAQLVLIESNAKLLNAKEITAPLRQGAPITSVIVTLQSTAAANALAVQSRASATVPDSFNRSDAPVFYDLSDQNIRSQLQNTVEAKVAEVTQQLSGPDITVTQRFSYQFGFAADVTAAGLEQILANPDVIRVELNGLLEPHLKQGIPLMNATTPRNTYTGSGLSIAICDTGIDTRHPMLGNGGSPIFNSKVIGGYDTGDGDADPRPDPTNGDTHGTECAGIAAGDVGSTGDYIGGVAPGAKLYALKISQGTGGGATNAAMIAAWEWAVTHKNDNAANPILIISTSFGGGNYSGTCDSAVPAMTTAAANAVSAGITIFASSGNDGYCSSMGWPACISYVNSVGAVYDANIGSGFGFCVAATSCATKVAYASCSTGYVSWVTSTAADQVTNYSNSANFLTLFAPSHNAYTTTIVGRGDVGDYQTNFGGTSAACPYAAGAAAVLQSAAKAKTGSFLTPAKVKKYLTEQGDSITDPKVAVTKPRVNVDKAVNAISGEVELPTTALYYLYIADYYHALANYYAKYGVLSNRAYWYYAYLYQLYAYTYNNYAYQYASSSPSAQYYAYYAYYYGYYAALYDYYSYLGYDYSGYASQYAANAQINAGFAQYYAAFGQ